MAAAVNGITLTANDTYLVPAVVLLASLRGNIPTGVEIIIRDTGLSTQSRLLLKRQTEELGCTLRFAPSDIDQFARAKLLPHFTTPDTFARLLSFPEVADQHRYLLDLDVDLLIRTNLDSLMQSQPEDGCLLAAVPAHFTPTIWQTEVGSVRDLGIRTADNFFMGGVAIIDTEQWQEARISERAQELFTEAPERWRSDLSVLNIVAAGKWSALEYKWNVWTLATAGPLRFVRVSGAATRSIARSADVAIAHFPGYFKPWLPGYPLNVWKVEYLRAAHQSVLPRRLLPKLKLGPELQRLARTKLKRR